MRALQLLASRGILTPLPLVILATAYRRFDNLFIKVHFYEQTVNDEYFLFSSTKHIVSHRIHKINIYFFFFWQKDKQKRDKNYASVPVTQVSNLFRKVYFCEFFMR